MAKFNPGDHVLKHGSPVVCTVKEIIDATAPETLYLLQCGHDSITVRESLLQFAPEPSRPALKGRSGLKRAEGKSARGKVVQGHNAGRRRKVTRRKVARKSGPRKR